MADYTKDFHYEDGVLHVKLTGDFPDERMNDIKNLFSPLIEACSTYNCTRVVVDARELHIDLGTIGLFNVGKKITTLSNSGLYIALVAREDMIDPFFTDVTSNRGGIVGVFSKMDKALEWLDSH